MRMTLATTVYEAEIELLGHQARSFSRFLSGDSVASVIVIDNTSRGLSPGEVGGLERAYGAIWPKVGILRPKDIARVPRSTGWRSQQILKLTLARRIDTSHYVVLDAKNHLIRTFNRLDYVGDDGRSRVPTHAFTNHPLRPSLERVLEYVGLRDVDMEYFGATTTPFPLDTLLVRQLLGDIEEKSGKPFEVEFLAQDLTEFFLYSAWVQKSVRQPELWIHNVPQTALTVWPSRSSDEAVKELISRARAEDVGVFAVHRAAFPHLAEEARRELAGFWCGLGFYAEEAHAMRYIVSMSRNFRRWDRAQKARDLSGRAATLFRRVRRRMSRS